MKLCPNPSCSHRRRVGSPAEFHDEVAACSDCGAALEAAPEEAAAVAPPEAPASSPAATALRRRIGLTLVAPLVLFAGERVLVPGLEPGAIEDYARELGLPSLGSGVMSVLALGIRPALDAFVHVEVAAAIVPRWRSLRHGNPVGRARLERAALILMLVFSLSQGFSVARWLQPMMAHPGLQSLLLVSLTLTAGVFFLLALGGALTRRGLGHGLVVLLAFTLFREELGRAWDLLRAPDIDLTPLKGAAYLAAAAGAAALTWRLLRGQPLAGAAARHDVRAEEARFSYRAAPLAAAPGRGGPSLASGLAPLTIASSLAAFPLTLANLGLPMGALPALLADRDAQLAVRAILAAGLAVLLAHAFNRPARVAAVRARLDGGAAELEDEARAELRAAVKQALLYLGALLALEQVAVRVTGSAPDVIAVAMLTAVAVDLHAERRARERAPELVEVWREQRPYAVDTAVRALAAQGITAHPRTAALRALLQIFGAFAPVSILVPPERADDARRALGEVLGSGEGPGAPRDEDISIPERRRPGRHRKAKKVRAATAP